VSVSVDARVASIAIHADAPFGHNRSAQEPLVLDDAAAGGDGGEGTAGGEGGGGGGGGGGGRVCISGIRLAFVSPGGADGGGEALLPMAQQLQRVAAAAA
jgi:hypothetical protein